MVMAKAYQKYKDAKLTWLENVPEGWQILRGKTVFRCIDMRSKDGSEELLSVSSKDGVVPRSSKKITMFMAESYAGYKLCWPGDLVINSLWAWMFGLGFSRHHGIVSSAYGVYRTRSQYLGHWQYFDYLIRSKAYAWELRVRSRGVWTSRLQMTDDRFLDMPILIPPKEEAIEIVKFLSVLDIQIRRYIREKQKVIKLLSEQKQAVINRAITKGINPNVRLKSSGFGWIGDVPEHWEVRRLKNFLLEPLKYGANEAAELTDRTLPRYVRITDIDKNGNLVDSSFRSLPVDIAEPYLLQEGDILLARSGATVGKSFLYFNSYGSSAYAGYLIRARIDPNIVSFAFFYNYLQSSAYWTWISLMTIQATIQNVSAEKYGCLPVPVPPSQEQELILKKIVSDCRPFDELICASHKDIEFMREYRIRLISDVVTGKMDVRNIKLPEIEDIIDSEPIEEQESLEDVEDTEEVVNADE